LDSILPSSQARLAKARVLKNLAAHSQMSMRTLVKVFSTEPFYGSHPGPSCDASQLRRSRCSTNSSFNRTRSGKNRSPPSTTRGKIGLF
jgi:hypothetical protein